MFELITGQAQHIPGGGTGPVVASSALHVLGLAAVITVPLLFVREMLPEVPTMMAFVVSAPAPPPPPPPPAPATARRPAPSTAPSVTAPVAEATIEPPVQNAVEPTVSGLAQGEPGGVEGGVSGGVVGGIVGGIDPAPPPEPRAVTVNAPAGPVRIGGQISAPTLVKRVEPIYPNVAVAARMQGVVILEAIVDTEGRVKDLKVLRGMPLLDRAAIDAVMQWRYSPVILNGTPVPFILTVVVSFTLPDPKQSRY